MELSQEELYNKALKKVSSRKNFYVSLVYYFVVNIFLFAINYFTDPTHWWFYWAALIWGVALIFHGFTVFFVNEKLGDDWEKKKVQELMEKDKEQ